MEFRTVALIDSTVTSSSAGRSVDPMMLRIEDCASLRLPPGLDLPAERVAGWLSCNAGPCHISLQEDLPAKICQDDSEMFESDDTSVGSSSSFETSPSSGRSDKSESVELELDAIIPKGLLLAEVSELKASSPSFVPALAPEEVSALLPESPEDVSSTPQRTKLSSQADAFIPSSFPSPSSLGSLPFVPSAEVAKAWHEVSRNTQHIMPLPFLPMAAVNEAWQNWSDRRMEEEDLHSC